MDIIVDGGESAKSVDRPGLRRILELVQERRVDAVIVTKLDRLTGSVRDLPDVLELFNRRGASLVSVAESLGTATASKRLVANPLIGVSQWEREAARKRTRFAMQYEKSLGERVETISHGFPLSADNRHLEPNPTEQTVLSLIRRLRNAGRALRAIAGELNRRNLTARRGSPWHHVYIAGALKNSGTETKVAS